MFTGFYMDKQGNAKKGNETEQTYRLQRAKHGKEQCTQDNKKSEYFKQYSYNMRRCIDDQYSGVQGTLTAVRYPG
jgi:hypothetical protein